MPNRACLLAVTGLSKSDWVCYQVEVVTDRPIHMRVDTPISPELEHIIEDHNEKHGDMKVPVLLVLGMPD